MPMASACNPCMHVPAQTRDVDNRQYVMFYEAVAADNTRSVGLAVSKDGRSDWQRCPNPVLGPGATSAGPSSCWDQGEAEGGRAPQEALLFGDGPSHHGTVAWFLSFPCMDHGADPCLG